MPHPLSEPRPSDERYVQELLQLLATAHHELDKRGVPRPPKEIRL